MQEMIQLLVNGVALGSVYALAALGFVIVYSATSVVNFAAGQFGYTASITQLPVVLPANPGIRFTPPPAFSSANGPSSGAPGSNKGSGDVDCEVR